MAPPALGPNLISYVNAGIEYIDDLENDNERDELVEQINLHGNSIQSMDGLEMFTGLVELCLSSNCIEEIAFYALQPLVNLRVLDLSANRILSTLGFPQLPRLEELSIAHNCLQGLDGITRPIKFPKLQYLDLRGNEIAEFNDTIVLQRLKHLAHLRLQAANGGQANPVCDLDGYDQVVIQIKKMLPRLKVLDEEDVDVLKEMGSLHMPKYRSLMRRIVDSHGMLSQSSHDSQVAPCEGSDRVEGSQERRLINSRRFGAASNCVETGASRLHQSACTAHNKEETLPTRTLVLKNAGTNTSVDLETELLTREHGITQRETELIEIDKGFLTKENAFLVREKSLESQVADLHEKLEVAETRAIKAEATVLEMSNRLFQKEEEQAATLAACDQGTTCAQKSQTEQRCKYEASLVSLTTTHQQEVEQLDAKSAELETKKAAIEAETKVLMQKLLHAEERLQLERAAVERSESKAAEMLHELELGRKTHESIVTHLSDEIKYYKDRVEQADKRSSQLETQVIELKANVETVYNKCIEKDESLQQLKTKLLVRHDDINALRSQHERDSERYEKVQQQQHDLYERQLQASIIQVEMEFRKEYQQGAQKVHSLQRKIQEQSKETKRVQEAYQQSLQREAAAKAEISKLQASLAADQKKRFVKDATQSDTFQAAIRNERAKCKKREQRLINEQKNHAQLVAISVERDEKRLENERLCHEIASLEKQLEKGKKSEDDLRAALKVKDVMLADQLRQINERTRENQCIDARFHEEMAEYQAQIEDLEVALDESLQKAAEEEVKNESLAMKLTALEKNTVKKEDRLRSVCTELELKVSALEFLDQEMQRMRTVLEDQDKCFQTQMQNQVEHQREEVERIRASAEEEREHQRHGWEAAQRAMMHKYEALATERENVAARNEKLLVALDQERRQTTQNDRDMGILLAQLDHERQSKRENLRQIKSLFEQLQRDIA